jgi:hypothetical protein
VKVVSTSYIKLDNFALHVDLLHHLDLFLLPLLPLRNDTLTCLLDLDLAVLPLALELAIVHHNSLVGSLELLEFLHELHV